MQVATRVLNIQNDLLSLYQVAFVVASVLFCRTLVTELLMMALVVVAIYEALDRSLDFCQKELLQQKISLFIKQCKGSIFSCARE